MSTTKARYPGSVGRPGAGIDENLDDERHGEERQGERSCCKADDQQEWKEVLGERGKVGGDDRIDQRQLVLFAKQIDRAVGDFPAGDLGLPRLPEDRGGKDAQGERGQPVGYAGKLPVES